MLVHFDPSSGIIVAMLVVCFFLVLAFEATNGFHDTSNAVATVIYTNALRPIPAVILVRRLNFVGVLVGGIAVAYALVEILPPDVLTPPDGAPAVPMLVSLFAAALFWNILTWCVRHPEQQLALHHRRADRRRRVGRPDPVAGAGPGRRLAADHQGARGAGGLADPGLRAGWRAVRAAAAGGAPGLVVRAAQGRRAAGLVAARPAGADLHRGQLLARHQRRPEEHRSDHADHHRADAGDLRPEPRRRHADGRSRPQRRHRAAADPALRRRPPGPRRRGGAGADRHGRQRCGASRAYPRRPGRSCAATCTRS